MLSNRHVIFCLEKNVIIFAYLVLPNPIQMGRKRKISRLKRKIAGKGEPPFCDFFLWALTVQCMSCTVEAVYQVYCNINCKAAFPLTGKLTSSIQSSVCWTMSHCWSKNESFRSLTQYGRYTKHCTSRCIMLQSVGGVTLYEAQAPSNVNVKQLWMETRSELSYCCQERCADVWLQLLVIICLSAPLSAYLSVCMVTCLFVFLSWHLHFSLSSWFGLQLWSHSAAAWKQIERADTTRGHWYTDFHNAFFLKLSL